MSERETSYNAADPEQVKKGELYAKEKKRVELADLKAIMAIPEGRRFIWRLINKICHYDTLSAQNSGSMTFLLEGERNVGIQVKSEAYLADFEAYQQMEKEYMKGLAESPQAKKTGKKG